MAQTQRQRVGRWGEAVAAHYLEQHGYTILAQNVRTRHGEVDLIARQQDELVFIEVKTRTNTQFGLPEEAVDARKLEHVFRAAEAYLETQAGLAGMAWRIDVIAIQGQPGAKVEDVIIEHFENIAS